MNRLSLSTTILSFAYSGLLPRHSREYEAPRTASPSVVAATPKKK